MEFEQILESMSEMEKKYFYSLNEDDKTQYILKKMDEDTTKNGVEEKIESEVELTDKGAERAKELIAMISRLEDEKAKANEDQKKIIDRKIAMAQRSLESIEKNAKNAADKKAAEVRQGKIDASNASMILKKAFGDELAKAFVKYKEEPKKIAFILNSIQNVKGKFNVETFNKSILKILDPNSTFTKDEAQQIVNYYNKSGFDFPYTADQLVGANDLSAYTRESKAFQFTVSKILDDISKIKTLAGLRIKDNEDVGSIFENIDLSDVDGDIIYEGLFDAISKPMNAASNLVGNLASAPFDLANSIFNGGKSLGKAAVGSALNAIKNKHAQNVANRSQKRAQKAQAKAQAKAERQASEDAIFGPIPEFQQLLKTAKNLNEINAAMPDFIEKLKTYFKQLGETFDSSKYPNLKVYKLKNKENLNFDEFIEIVNGSNGANFHEADFNKVVEIAKQQSESSGSENLSDEGASQQTNTTQKSNPQTQSNNSETQTQGNSAAKAQQTNANSGSNLSAEGPNQGNSQFPHN